MMPMSVVVLFEREGTGVASAKEAGVKVYGASGCGGRGRWWWA